MNNLRIGDFLIAIVYLAALFTLVRPRSQGPALVDSVTKGTVNLVNAATGGGSF